MLAVAGGIGYSVGSHGNVDQAALNAMRARQQVTNKKIEKAVSGLAATQGIRIRALLGEGLKDPSKLPGQGQHVSSEDREKLATSSVAIVSRSKSPSYFWRATCSGTKISIEDRPYVLTAQHCLQYNFDDSQIPPHSRAADVLPVDSRTYAIARSSTDSVQNNRTPIANVTAASVIVGGQYRPDMALLRVSPVTEGGGAGLFGDIPAIPLKDYAVKPPEPGSEVAFHSVPASTSKVAVNGLGTYLGRIPAPDQSAYKVDIFGLDVTEARQDPAMPGASGSGVIGANGHMFGDLITRTGSPAEKHVPLSVTPSYSDFAFRLRQSEALGIDDRDYPVVATSVVPPRFAFFDLVNGLDNPIPVLAG